MNLVPAPHTCLRPTAMHYCPGCGHAALNRLLARAIDRLKAAGRAVGVVAAGCAARAYNYLDMDMAEAPRGRAVAVAAGLKRSLPEALVFCYQSLDDGMGAHLGQLMASAGRGESIACIQVNNLRPGTGPAGPIGLDLCELLAGVQGARFVARAALDGEEGEAQVERLLELALASQEREPGLAWLEVLAPCPTRWRMEPDQARDFLARRGSAGPACGVFKGRSAGGQP